LVLDEIGRTSLPIRVNNHLHVTEIWNGVERRVNQSINAGRDAKDGENEDEKFVPRTRLD